MAGMDLSNRDVQAMLRMVRTYDPVGKDEVLPDELCRDLLDLIRCDSLNIEGRDSVRRSDFAGQYYDGPDETGGYGELDEDTVENDTPFWLHYLNCLPCSYPCRSGDIASVTKISDFMSARQWHNTGMYADVLGEFNVEHEIMVCLPVGPAHTRTLRLHFARLSGSDFSERDRAVLTLLRPHLHAAFLSARRSRPGRTPLTARQVEILRHVAAGYSNHQIARRLDVAEGTVRKHLENVFTRLQVGSRAEAVARAGPELWPSAASNPLYVRRRMAELPTARLEAAP